MSLKIRMARAGTKKRPFYHIVIADSRSPRDGRFIERIGYFNPLLPKDHKDRLSLDLEKAKAWLAKGALPSDRISRFLDAAGVMKREKRNNPEKAIPRKERKAQAEAAAKGASAPAAEHLPRGRVVEGVKRPRPGEGVVMNKKGKAPISLPWRRTSPAESEMDVRSRVCVAQIGAAHGVRGEVRLRSFTADPLAVKDYGALESEDGALRLEIEALRPAKDHLVARLAGIRDRDAAERLRNIKLFVPRDRLPATGPDEFYHADLIGLAAVTATAASTAAWWRCTISAPGRCWRSGRRRAATRSCYRSPRQRCRRSTSPPVALSSRHRKRHRGKAEPCGAPRSSPSFPICFPARSVSALRARRWTIFGSLKPSTSALTPPTGIVPWTIRRQAVAPGW